MRASVLKPEPRSSSDWCTALALVIGNTTASRHSTGARRSMRKYTARNGETAVSTSASTQPMPMLSQNTVLVVCSVRFSFCTTAAAVPMSRSR